MTSSNLVMNSLQRAYVHLSMYLLPSLPIQKPPKVSDHQVKLQ